MGRRNKRKRKTLTDPTATSSAWRRRRRLCEDDQHVAERRDWASLPRDVLCIILGKLPQTDILRGAGLVCSHWRRLALHEPQLWRHIDLRERGSWHRREPPPAAGWKAMARAAVDRSAGRCESYKGHVNADVLVHLANRAPLLRELHVRNWPDIDDAELTTGIVKKLPMLERLVMVCGLLDEDLIEALLDHCPRLELLDAKHCRPAFWMKDESIASKIRSSTIKDLRLPKFNLF